MKIRKQPFQINPDKSRVITRMFSFSEQRVRGILDRILALPAAEVRHLVTQVLTDYGRRHKSIHDILLKHYKAVIHPLDFQEELTEDQKLLIGAYFTMEYAVESAALFNPSIVFHPDQTGIREGCARVVLSLRAVGEGHVSSIEFRSAVVDENNDFHLDPVNRFVATADVYPDRHYDKHLFRLKLFDMTLAWEPSALDTALRMVGREIIDGVMDKLGDRFTFDELRWFMGQFRAEYSGERTDVLDEVYERMILLARSNYEIRFGSDSALSERVIFPVSAAEAGGIEDARFVRFQESGEKPTYYATYTAYDRKRILTQVMETDDFSKFKIHTLNGKFAQSKGMAFFPRKVNGRYAMISRIDGENLFLMYSDNLHFWDNAERLRMPLEPWELTQVGNCGSPIETEAGWLLLTHGVGPLRCYSIGVVLLDLEDPSKVIGSLKKPLLNPDGDEREGYVPNVVYSCGGLIHNGELIVPYAVSDTASRVAVVPLQDLLDTLKETTD